MVAGAEQGAGRRRRRAYFLAGLIKGQDSDFLQEPLGKSTPMFCEVHHPVMRTAVGGDGKRRKKKRKEKKSLPTQHRQK